MKKILVFVIGAFVISACLPQGRDIPQSPLLAMLERKSGLIAYMGVDGNMYVSDQGGGNLVQLTDDAELPENQGQAFLYYQHPTWARDGSQLAFVGLSSDGEQVETRVIVAEPDGDSQKEVHRSESEFPIYLNWSPDNENVGFISSNQNGDNIILQSVPAAGGERTILDVGSPYYWSWAPDGNAMIVHAGGAAASVPEHLAFLDVDAPVITEQAVDVTAEALQEASTQAFQAPAWSPDGSRIALARVLDRKNEVIVTDAAGENPETVGTFTQKTAFAWSSDGTRLAYLDGKQALEAGTIGPLHVVDFETSEEIVQDEDIIAFFWSPSGEEIAYFVLLQIPPEGGSSGEATPQFGLVLHVLDVASGESREIVTYRPTQQFLSILPYFDQYHQSATIWSPDNNNLVLSFLGESGPGIAVVAASGNLEPRFLAQAFIAFWSWE